MTELPTVRFANTDIKITRLISGANPLCGYSHVSRKMNQDMAEYFTDENAVAYLESLQSKGINTFQGRTDFHRVLHWLELFRRRGGKLHWIAQTAPEMSDAFQNTCRISQLFNSGRYGPGVSVRIRQH